MIYILTLFLISTSVMQDQEDITNDSLAVLIKEHSTQIIKEIITDPLKDKRYGIELSPLYTMFDGFTPNGGFSFSGSYSIFTLFKDAELALPFSYHSYDHYDYYSNETTSRSYFYIDSQYRLFLGKYRNGRWIGTGIRFYKGEDNEGSYSKGGISFGMGRRVFSKKGWYWGSSLYLGKYYFGQKDRESSSFFKLELFKFGFAFK